MLLVKILGSKKSVVCAREGGANTTPLFLAAHFAKRATPKAGRASSPVSLNFQNVYVGRAAGN